MSKDDNHDHHDNSVSSVGSWQEICLDVSWNWSGSVGWCGDIDLEMLCSQEEEDDEGKESKGEQNEEGRHS